MPSSPSLDLDGGDHRSALASEQSDKESDSEREHEMDNDDDVEYEEIEEEVEVEEYIEVEEEVDEEEDEEIGEEELSDSPIVEDRNDVSQGMASKEHEEHRRSGSCDPEKSVANPLSDSVAAVDGGIGNSNTSSTSETRQKGESHIEMERNLVASECGGFRKCSGDKKDPERGTPKDDVHNDVGASLDDSGIITAKTTKPSSGSSQEVAAGILIRDGFSEEANYVASRETEISNIGTQSLEDINQGLTRSAVPLIRPRSLSPVAEFNDGNKRPAVICEFFAKGWCIKGSSCRFLHIKDHVNITSQKPVGDVAAVNEKSELLAHGGLRDGAERSQSADLPNATASSVAYGSFSLEMTPSLEQGGSPRWHHSNEKPKIFSLKKEDLSHAVSPDSLHLPICKDNARSVSSFKDVGKENLKQNWCSDDYPIFRSSSFPEHRSLAGNSVISSDTYRSSSHETSLDDMVTRRGHFMLYDKSSLIVSGPMNSSVSSSLPITGILPSQSNSTWMRSSFSVSSFDTDPLGVQKLSDSDEHRVSRSASLLHSSLPFSGSGLANRSLTNVPGDSFRIAHKTKISSNDWEPSVPFRPSFFVTQSLSSSGSLYDPIRDSIEQPNLGDGLSKFCSRAETASITNAHVSMNADPVLVRTLGPDSGSDKHSASGHYKFHDNKSYKNSQEKDFFTTENRSSLNQEEKLLNTANVKDFTKADKLNLDSDPRLQKDGPSRTRQLKVDRSRQNDETEVDCKTDGEPKESKALKHFRAALVDSVKELVKPRWHEGRLSKDAHKMVVRKAVDKVLGTFQPDEIPSTMESINQYLSISKPKISKLVEGYVVKYGKS